MGKVNTPYDELTYKIIGAAMAVHNDIGPGFPEEVYHRAMMIALSDEKVSFEHELPIEIFFRGQKVGEFKMDFVAERKVVLEFKAVTALDPAHERQVISYLTASGLDVGLLINFGAARLKYERIFPPKDVQESPAFQERKKRFAPIR